MNACYADVGITGIMPTPRSCRLLTRDPRRSCLRPAEIRHNQRLFKQATAGRRADVGPVSLQQVQQCCDFANGQKVRKQRVSRERLTDTRHFARPLPSSVFFFPGFIARSEKTSGLCRIQLVSRAGRSARNKENTKLPGDSRHDRGVGMMPKIVNPRLETCAIRATDSDLFAKSPECPPKKIVRYAFAQLGDEKRSARLL